MSQIGKWEKEVGYFKQLVWPCVELTTDAIIIC